MTGRRILIFGNSGSGKTTMARSLHAQYGFPCLDLDSIAWVEAGVRLSIADSLAALRNFQQANSSWVIEGSYGDLIEAALSSCTELRLLNPGVEVCVANCRRRPWEPDKYATPEEQNKHLAFLLDWVRQYEQRDDEYGLSRHRAIFESFPGEKHEYVAVDFWD